MVTGSNWHYLYLVIIKMSEIWLFKHYIISKPSTAIRFENDAVIPKMASFQEKAYIYLTEWNNIQLMLLLTRNQLLWAISKKYDNSSQTQS